MELSLQTRTVADHTVLEVGGEIDVYTAPKLKERLLELVADGTKQIVVDLEGVEFLDSTGLGVLVGGLRRIRTQGGHLALVCTQERILKIFRITGLATFFDIYSSVAASVEADGGGDADNSADPGGSPGGGQAAEPSGQASDSGADAPERHSGRSRPEGGRDDGDTSAGTPPVPGS